MEKRCSPFGGQEAGRGRTEFQRQDVPCRATPLTHILIAHLLGPCQLFYLLMSFALSLTYYASIALPYLQHMNFIPIP